MFSSDSKILLLLTGLSHFTVHSAMLIFPAIMSLLMKEFEVNLSTLGWVYMISNFMFGLGAIPAGWIERKIGGRKLLLIYLLGAAASGIMVVISRDLTTLTVALMMLGLFCSIYHPAGLTLISRRIRQTSRAMGYHGIAGSAGLAAGPLLAAWLAINISWRWAYGSLALFCLALAAVTAIVIPTRKTTVHEENVVHDGPTRILPLFMYYIIAVLIGLTFYGFSTYMPIHFSENLEGVFEGLDGVVKGGFFATLVLVAGIPGQLLGGRWGDRFDKVRLVQLIAIAHIPLLIAFGMNNSGIMILSGILLGVVHFMIQPIGNALIASFTSDTSRGLGYGISFFLSFGIGSLASGFGGNLAVKYGVSMVFPFVAILMFMVFFVALFLRRAIR
ncbi:MAG: hypothetical protein CMF77_04770 [Candidatus Marinimicrobia bacterium]|nr:hypothetical protein [Candidatus Neomarinimicrobiota bacterium]